MKKYFELIMSILIMVLVIFIEFFLYTELDQSFGKTSIMLLIFVMGSLVSYIYYIMYKIDN
jgi:hypothetical protein